MREWPPWQALHGNTTSIQCTRNLHVPSPHRARRGVEELKAYRAADPESELVPRLLSRAVPFWPRR